jgi:hypothetical protein
MDVQSDANNGACCSSYADADRFTISIAVIRGSSNAIAAGSSSTTHTSAILGRRGGAHSETKQHNA